MFCRYYCPGGQSSATPKDYPCPQGHFCGEGSAYPTPCGNGTYQNASAQDSCLQCPAGFYCDPGEGTTVSPKLCPAGHYCLPGTSYKKTYPCKARTYGPDMGFAFESQCVLCTNGSYCETDGLSAPTGKCYGGYYCLKGSKSPVPVNDMNTTTSTFDYFNDKCPKGYFCPNGTANPQPCPRGYFSNNDGLKLRTECQKCPPGKYCNVIGQKELRNPPNCSAGYVCLGASSTPTPTTEGIGYQCPKGFYCPEGTLFPFTYFI